MTRNIFLTGTANPEPKTQALKAGKLEAVYDAGALRWIKWDGLEILRAIMFLVRTPGWGTPPADISNLSIEQATDRFSVSYDAHYGAKDNGVVVQVLLEGSAAGSLSATSTIRSEVPFDTNRSGFVILHPLDGFAGTLVNVDHANDPARALEMPAQISPGQPVMDMQAITHKPVSGLTVETRFEGDIFEMEDHRNWSDASFKTYSRPIGLPYPYQLLPDEPVEQAVHIKITDDGASSQAKSAVAVPIIADQKMPPFALPLDTVSQAAKALEQSDAMRALAPNRIMLRFDSTVEKTDVGFSDLAKLLEITGATLELQIVLEASGDDVAGIELSSIGNRLKAAGVAVSHVSAFAKVDEQSFQPGQERPPHPSEKAIAAHLADQFPEAKRIGGTPAFFTEFNRKRPDPSLWHGVTFATTPVVHAADDASVMETLQSLPHILGSAVALAGGLPIAVGPTGIGARLNPYGPAPSDNDPDEREGMAAQDPRQRGLFAAAWIVGYLANIAPFGLERFAFGAPVGPFGLVSTPQKFPRAYWDDQSAGAAYPLYHVARWVNAAGGGTILGASTQNNVAQLLWERNGRRFALMANLATTPRPIPKTEIADAQAIVLDASRLAALSSDFKPEPSTSFAGFAELDAYAVIFVREGGGQ